MSEGLKVSALMIRHALGDRAIKAGSHHMVYGALRALCKIAKLSEKERTEMIVKGVLEDVRKLDKMNISLKMRWGGREWLVGCCLLFLAVLVVAYYFSYFFGCRILNTE